MFRSLGRLWVSWWRRQRCCLPLWARDWVIFSSFSARMA